MTRVQTAIFVVDMCCVSIDRVGSFLARIRWFSEQNLDAITRGNPGKDGSDRLRSFQYFLSKRPL